MKRVLITLLILGLIAIAAVVVINLRVRSYSTDRIYNDPASVPTEDRIAIVLGARVRRGVPSDMLYDRVLTGVELYKAGKTQKLLLSGGSDEPSVMKKLALEFGVPESDLILDDLGLRTYESCVRAKQAFQIEKAIIVTQGFHLPRSIYLCQSMGIDSIGLNADRRDYDAEGFGENREFLANVRAWFDINFRSLPPEPTEKQPISTSPLPTKPPIPPEIRALTAEELCDRIANIETIPTRDPMITDPIYEALIAKGEDAIPCLVDKISDSTKIPDPRYSVPHWQHFAIGDAAVFILIDILRNDELEREKLLIEMLPPRSQEEWETNGIYAYFNYVSEPRNRKDCSGGGGHG